MASTTTSLSERYSPTNSRYQGDLLKLVRCLPDDLQMSFLTADITQAECLTHRQTIKNMQMIQKQIQTNTNIAKNRLAKKSHFDPNESIGLGL